jgi:uncharacterized membrane protein YidH (DUF202 family)
MEGTGNQPVARESPRDPGVQPERTRLAWRRTTLACVAVAVLAGRLALHDKVSLLGLAATLCITLATAAFLGVARLRVRTLNAAPPPPAMSPGVSAAAVACLLAIAVLGGVLLF